MQIPQQVAYIIDKLNTRGFEAYAVGGCVRDTLLGREPGDWDITTSAKPEQVKALFRRTVDTGIQHGTVTVLIDRTGYEVTTYRIDGIYEDGRHPRQVEFTSDLLEDLRRRDFTINAMAYSHDKGIVDAFDGMGDLKRKVIRCVGNPMERFSEDALRILRAIRFSAQLDFSIEKETWEAIGQIAPNIAKVSRERIQVELTKLLLSDHPERMMDVFETGISSYIFGESYQLLRGKPDVPENISRLLKETALSERRNLQEAAKLPGKKYIRWAAFLSRAGADGAVRILKDLKLDNETIRRVKTLVSWAGRELPEEEAFVRRGMSQMEPEVWDGVLALNGYSPAIREMTRRIRERGDCLDLKHLAVSGQDLIAAGVTPGKEMGEILGRLLEHVLERPEDNRKEVLLGLGKPDVPVGFRNSIPSAAVRVQEALNCRQKLEQ
ncbi:MAG: CCA tRNA nucleotidyltransferase [Lachnospiraceae bacterium]|nr:CCA tRNA nucleotidyltransferase [Lachnospiraceae bacterium]